MLLIRTARPDDGRARRSTTCSGRALALLPVALGIWALSRLPDESPSRTTAGAAVVVAGVSVVLRLVIAVRTGVRSGS